MASSGKKQLSGLINRLLELPAWEGQDDMGDHFLVLVESVDADVFATLLVNSDGKDARILAGSGLRTPENKWQFLLDTPRLVNWSTIASSSLGQFDKGQIEDDPFLSGEGVRALLVKQSAAGEMRILTIAGRREDRAFTKKESERFAAVAGVMNIILINGHLQEEKEASKGVDKLTGLHFFHDFHERMVEEISRARRGGGSVTMGILTVQPTGPGSADDALADMARNFLGQLRNFDTLVRYGSTELAFILPDLKGTEGVPVVERVLGEIVTSLGGEGTAPRVYVGLSCYPEDGATVERLIEMAEAAMNLAVEEARPGVYRWQE